MGAQRKISIGDVFENLQVIENLWVKKNIAVKTAHFISANA